MEQTGVLQRTNQSPITQNSPTTQRKCKIASLRSQITHLMWGEINVPTRRGIKVRGAGMFFRSITTVINMFPSPELQERPRVPLPLFWNLAITLNESSRTAEVSSLSSSAAIPLFPCKISRARSIVELTSSCTKNWHPSKYSIVQLLLIAEHSLPRLALLLN